jgi:hypothetical protein
VLPPWTTCFSLYGLDLGLGFLFEELFGGSSRWDRESERRGFQGGCRHGMEWPELAGIWAKLAGIWPAAGLEEGGGRMDEGRGKMGLGCQARVWDPVLFGG